MKKNFKLSLILLAGGFCFSINSFAQNWQLGGNPPAGPNGVNGGNNILGTPAGIPLRFFTGGGAPANERMRITPTGLVGMGNNLAGFTPVDQFQLYQNVSTFLRMRFTHAGTGSTNTDGTSISISGGTDGNGNPISPDFRISQHEKANVDIFTLNNGESNVIRRFRVAPNGQVFVGSLFDAENIVNSTDEVDDIEPFNSFSQAPTSLLNVKGPINSCADLTSSGNNEITVLYAYTSPYGNPNTSNQDGFRMKQNLNFRGDYLDALVFEKTDAGANDPEGYIAFTNTGSDDNEEVSLYIDGFSRSCFGKNLISPLQNRLTIDSEWNASSGTPDASKSGLRLVDLVASQNLLDLDVNPGLGVLSVDAEGDVIYVPGGGGTGGTTTANNGLTMSTLTNVQLGGTLLQPTAVNQAGFHMHFLNHGEFGVGGIDGNSKVTIQNTASGSNPAYTNIFRLKDVTGNNVPLQIFDNGVTRAIARKTNSGNHNSFSFTTNIENNDDAYSSVIGVSSTFPIESSGIVNAQFMGYYASLFNKLGNTTGLEIIVRGVDGEMTDGTNHGEKITVRNGKTNIGSYYEIGDDYAGNDNTGIFARVKGNGNVYGIYTTVNQLTPTAGSVAYAGYFDGDVHITGQLSITNGPTLSSDQMFKTNINTIPNALDKISALQPHTYNYDTVNYADFNFESDQQMGLIAQEVEQVLPTLVSTHKRPATYDSLGNLVKEEIIYKGVEYDEIIPLLVAGMQEQQSQIQHQEEQIQSKDSIISGLKNELTDVNARLTQLENCLSALLPTLCSMNQEAIQRNNEEQQKQYEKTLNKTDNSQTENSELRSALEIRLSDKNAIILSQNVPNPFAEMTTIKYSIPTTVKEAQIHFYTNKGIIINSVDIVERGNGEIRVFAEDLSSGLYTYSLVADGKIVATKKMVKN